MCAVIATLAASFGFGYGHANHNSYLIDGLVRLHPDFLAHDWFARETVHYHSTFYYVMRLAAAGGSFAWNMGVLNSACIALSLAFVYRVCTRASRTYPLGLFLLLAVLLALEKTFSVGGTFLFSSYLQPSTLGYVFATAACWYFIAGNFFASGAALAAGGFFHTNFLLLGFAVFGLAHVLSGRDRLVRRLFAQFAASGVVLAFRLPFLLSMTLHENGALAGEIFTQVRSPHHYLPSTYVWDFVPLAAWHCAALGLFTVADPVADCRRRLGALYGSFLGLMAAGVLLTAIFYVPFVSRLFVWRFAPFSVLFAQIVVLSAVVRYLHQAAQAAAIPLPRWRAGLVAAGVALLGASYQHEYRLFAAPQIVMALFVGAMIAACVFVRSAPAGARVRPRSLYALALLFLVSSYAATSDYTWRHSTLLNGFPGSDETELYQWARGTDKASIFVVPPDLLNFRLHAARAIVVDWKSIPVDPDGVLQWYERIRDVSGVSNLRSEREALEGYERMGPARLESLRERYGVDYYVRYASSESGQPVQGSAGFETVFRNDRFEVKAVRAPRRSLSRGGG